METPSEFLYNSRLVRRASRNLFNRLRWCYIIGNLVIDQPNASLRNTPPTLLKKIISGVRLLCILSLTSLFFYKTRYTRDRFFFQLPYTLASLLYMILGIELNCRYSAFKAGKLELLKSLIQFDVSYLQYVDENYNDNHTYRSRTLLAVFFMVSTTISTILTFGASDTDLYLLLPEVIGRISMAWCGLSIIMHALEIKTRYDNLNCQVKNMGKGKEKSIFIVSHISPETENTTTKLYYINRLHYKLYDIINRLSDIYNMPMLLIAIVSICHMVTDLYYLYKVMFLDISVVSKSYAILHACRMVMLFLEIVALFYTCAEVCDSANITPVLLHQYRNDFYHNKIDSHIQMYSLQHLHQKVSITVSGFFEVDLSGIYTVIGAVVTYLLILIQFDKPPEKN